MKPGRAEYHRNRDSGILLLPSQNRLRLSLVIYTDPEESRITYAVPKYFVKSITYIGEITPIFEKYFYNPISSYVLNISNKVRWVHTGSIHVYLAYIFVTLIIAIMFYIYQE